MIFVIENCILNWVQYRQGTLEKVYFTLFGEWWWCVGEGVTLRYFSFVGCKTRFGGRILFKISNNK